MHKRKLLPFILSGLCLAIATPQSVGHAQTASEKKPAVARDIAEEWEGHFTMLLMLGAGDRVYETSVHAAKVPWMTHLFTGLQKNVHFDRKNPIPEHLINEGVRTIFLTTGHDVQAAELRKLGLHAYSIPIHDYPTFLECVRKTSRIVGTEYAQKKLAVFEERWKTVMDNAAKQEAVAKKPKVLHIASLEPLLIDGRDSLIDEWIHLAGGENAAKEVKGYLKPADWEQLMVWNPDLVIVESGAGDVSKLSSQAGRFFLKGRKVVRNPSGIHSWDRYGPETLLQIQWATDIIHNGKIDEAVWVPKVQQYYKDIYNLTPTADEVKLMLKGEPPVA